MSTKIPFAKPDLGEHEIRAVVEALQARHLIGNGPIGRRLEARLRDYLAVKWAFLTTSCTHALETAMLLADIGPGDEVIMPSYTFVSTANAVVLRGATPVFADIEPGTLNIDPEDAARRMSSRTKAIIVVHYAGVGCRMRELMSLSSGANLLLVEDAAQAFGASYGDRMLGTLGQIGCYSFHATKNITAGEGGCIVTNEQVLADRIDVIREKGTNRTLFLEGAVDKYTWVDVGSSYVLSDVLAALLEAQLDRVAQIQLRRRQIWERYWNALEDVARGGRIQLPVIPDDCQPNYHSFFFLAGDRAMRDRLLSQLQEAGIAASFHFVPLHSSPMARRLGLSNEHLPNTDGCASRIIRLPLWTEMTDSEIDFVAWTTRAALRRS